MNEKIIKDLETALAEPVESKLTDIESANKMTPFFNIFLDDTL